MSYLENFDTTTVGAIPAGWVNDADASVVAVAVHSSPNSLGTSFDNTTGHWAYFDTPDDGSGNNTYEVWVQFDTALQIAQLIYRLAPGAGFGHGTYYGLLLQPSTAGLTNGHNALFQRSVAGAGANVAEIPVLPSGAIPTGTPIRVRVLADGDSHKCEIFIPSFSAYVAPDGTTSATQQNCIEFADTDPAAFTGAGRTGVLWFQGAGTTILFDDLGTTPVAPARRFGVIGCDFIGCRFIKGSP